jgi:beta-lactam-binding protein with PASTA domain
MKMPDPGNVIVPDLLNLTRSDAEAKIKGADLLPGNVTTVSSATVPSGRVSGANPVPGTSVDPGTAVNLEVSSGPPQIVVPDLTNLSQPAAEAKLKSLGLSVGLVTTSNSATVTLGSVSKTNPPVGTTAGAGSSVSLELSSGQPTIAVPNVVGLTRSAAEAILKSGGLTVGAVKTQRSNSVPADGVNSTEPDAGSLVNVGTAVELELSTGPEPNWTQYIPTALFALLGILLLSVLIYIVTENGQEFLKQLADKEVARGLITFLIAIATVGIAIILAISTLVLTEGEQGDKRFDRGKQVLAVLIGVLGTIVGFYFGAAPDTAKPKIPTEIQKTQPKIATTTLPDGTANKAYPGVTFQTSGLILPLKWSVSPALPAGLSLDSASGMISGTPTAAFASKTPFTFTVTDSATPPVTLTEDLKLEIK